MFLGLLSIVGNDKYIEHPELGTLSCSSMYQAFKKCHELLNTQGSLPIQCRSLHDLSLACYRKKSTEEVRAWIDEKLDERKRLYKFLKEEGSLLPELERQHAIFDVNTIEGKGAKSDESSKVTEYIQKESKNNKTFF